MFMMGLFRKIKDYVTRVEDLADKYSNLAYQAAGNFNNLESRIDSFSNKPLKHVLRGGVSDFSEIVSDFYSGMKSTYNGFVKATNDFISKDMPNNYRESVDFVNSRYNGSVSDVSDILLGKNSWKWSSRVDEVEEYFRSGDLNQRKKVGLEQLRKTLDKNKYLRNNRPQEYVRLKNLFDMYVC